MMQIFEYTVNYFKTGNFYDEDCSQKMPKHGATSLLFLLRLLLKITLVYTNKNHMMRNRRRIMNYCQKVKYVTAYLY